MQTGYYISKKDYDTIINYAQAAYDTMKAEIGGMAICYQDKDGDWIVTDPVILKQDVTGSTCDLDKEELQFPFEITKKQLDPRQIPIQKDFYDQMMIWKTEWATLKGREPSGKDYIFPGRFNGSHITSRSFMYAHEEALERAEITKATTHSYRRTQLSQLHKKGVPLRVVQKLSGHRSLDTLQRYLEVSDQDKRDAIKHLV